MKKRFRKNSLRITRDVIVGTAASAGIAILRQSQLLRCIGSHLPGERIIFEFKKTAVSGVDMHPHGIGLDQNPKLHLDAA